MTSPVRGLVPADRGRGDPVRRGDDGGGNGSGGRGGGGSGGRGGDGRYRPAHARQRSTRPLARQIEGGIGRVFLDAVSARSGTLVIGLVLARMMSPREFGAFGIAVVALLGAQSIGQLGAGNALSRWRAVPVGVVPTVTVVSVASSAAVYAAWYLAAPALAAGMGAPAAAQVIRLVTLTVLISGLVTAPRAMLHQRAPWLRMMIEQADNWIGVAVTIGLAVAGHGLMSFAVGRIAGSLASAALFIIFSPKAMRIGINPGAVRALLPAALPFAASGLVAFAISNVDQIIVGRMLHPRDLGYYAIALCLASWPMTVLSQPVRDSAAVAFIRFRRGPRVAGSAFMSSANLLAALILPACVLISSSAGPLVQLIYGPTWAPGRARARLAGAAGYAARFLLTRE